MFDIVFRFRGPPMGPRMNFEGPISSQAERQSIIKDNALKDFDRLGPTDNDNSWAAAADSDVDYSAKLVFSDEDEGPSSANSRLDKKYGFHLV